MPSRFLFVLAIFVALVVAAPAQAAPGALNVFVVGNQGSTNTDLATAIAAEPGVASATAFFSDAGTPTAAELAVYDVVVSIGDSSYQDPALWGDRLADYIDAGGPVLQTAYDNWEQDGAAPTGRFESGGYAPLLRGDNENLIVTLGTLVMADHPLVQGLGAFPTSNNTTTPLAPGATLLAKWSDDRNAIAFKGRVASVSASPGIAGSIPGIARLAVNTGNYLGRRNVTIAKSGTGVGTVSSAPAGLLCGATCSQPFAFGSKPVFTATPAPDSLFKGWSGACIGVGPCEPTIADSALSIGAVFDLATFGSKTQVTLSASSTKVSSSGKLKVRIRNGNGFTVKGSLAGTVGKAKIKSKSFTLKAKGSKTVQLTLSKALRKLLAEKGKLKVQLKAKLKSPSGKSRTVNKRLTIKPRS